MQPTTTQGPSNIIPEIEKWTIASRRACSCSRSGVVSYERGTSVGFTRLFLTSEVPLYAATLTPYLGTTRLFLMSEVPLYTATLTPLRTECTYEVSCFFFSFTLEPRVE